MVTDQFGMIGLLTFIRAAETEPNLVTLALGRYAMYICLCLRILSTLVRSFLRIVVSCISFLKKCDNEFTILYQETDDFTYMK